jgi:hypothetical protein
MEQLHLKSDHSVEWRGEGLESAIMKNPLIIVD